jgi:lipopolysaccharide/colanic/teichoic acid biosynthesis glycosyltransferase
MSNDQARRLARGAAPTRTHHPGAISRAGKRLVDVVVGTVLAVVALPVTFGLSIAMGLSLRAAPLFIHERVGRNGESFRVVKIRTLPVNTSAYADKREIDATGKGLARIVRRLHLDELPQLMLVPIGRMSLVGPRPEMAHLYRRMPERQGGTRLRFRPGCTGLWQISVAHGHLIAESPEYDIFYAEHRSWRLDLWILWKTLLVMSGLGQPITLDDVPRWACRTTIYEETGDRATPVKLERRRQPRYGQPAWLTKVEATAGRTRLARGSSDRPAAIPEHGPHLPGDAAPDLAS